MYYKYNQGKSCSNIPVRKEKIVFLASMAILVENLWKVWAQYRNFKNESDLMNH